MLDLKSQTQDRFFLSYRNWETLPLSGQDKHLTNNLWRNVPWADDSSLHQQHLQHQQQKWGTRWNSEAQCCQMTDKEKRKKIYGSSNASNWSVLPSFCWAQGSPGVCKKSCLVLFPFSLPSFKHPSIIVQSSRNRQINAWLTVTQQRSRADRQVFIQTLALMRIICLPVQLQQKCSWVAALLPHSWESLFLPTLIVSCRSQLSLLILIRATSVFKIL